MSARKNDPPKSVKDAIRVTVIACISNHGEQGIGIVLCGVPLLGLAAIGHFLLGSVPVEVITGASGVGFGTAALIKSRASAE
jgi:hypothetical protein